MKSVLKALILALIDIFKDWRYAAAHEEALKENARRDAEARALAGQAATEERINREKHKLATDDAAAFRERLRARDPETR